MSNFPQNPAGYTYLIERFQISTIPHWHQSAIASIAGNHRVEATDGTVLEVYPLRYFPGESIGEHLEFALKYDGTNLLILARLFAVIPQEIITNYVQSKPSGKYARRIWYVYEFLTGNRLPLDDVAQGNYIDLLEPDDYYTSPGKQISRQRVRNNLLGSAAFCPTVRRTERLSAFEQLNLSERSRRIIEAYPIEILKRALAYLYTKESKSSFEIEHIKPTADRTERFVSLLHVAEREDFVSKPSLVNLQNRIVDERFRDADYRTRQNYVGETVAWQNERVHYVSPKPENLAQLMDGMIAAHGRISDGESLPPAIHAAIIGYSFVFMHPFEDGNGRIHRFLIHNILARRGFAPQGIMFPVSAVMLKRMDAYDASLEAFSRPLMEHVNYELDEQGRMNVANDTADFYRYIDLTTQAEALFDFIRETIEVELVNELRFLTNYDQTKRAIQGVADIPDRLIDLFIRLCLQNNGTLSKRKRDEFFKMMNDQEVAAMEEVVRTSYHRE